MSRRRGVGWLLALASLDLVATAALVLLVFPAITFSIMLLSDPLWKLTGYTYTKAIVEWINYALSGAALGVYVYTTFTTTVWTWLYLAAEGMFRVLPVVRRFGPVEQRPFRSMGLVVALLGGACWFAVGVIDRVWKAVVDTL